MGQAQSFEMDCTQLDDIHLQQLNFGAYRSCFHAYYQLLRLLCSNSAQIEFRYSVWTVAGVFGNKTDVRSSICNQVNRSSRRASEARAAWLRQL